MDFLHRSVHLEIMHKTDNYSYDDECEDEDEDDVLYRELRRQVLQLTAEEDDNESYENTKRNMAIDAQKGSPNNNNTCGFTQQRWYYDWPANEDLAAPPTWILNLWRTGNGTGVFIPQVVHSMRKNRARRKKNESGRITIKTSKMN